MNNSDSSTRTTKAREAGRIVPIVVLVVMLLAFVVDNSQRVTVGFVFTQSRVPLIFVLVATALIGAIIGQLAVWRRRR